ncbi:DUF1631 family protein [Massilia aurea]|uniref:DUF1631 family protein n=1 Tax=Massilia aurea TaxID=373040 RepID=UPI00346368F5
MATPSAQTHAARKAAAAQQATLAELVDIACRQAGAELADVARRIVSVLLDLTAAGPDPRTVMRRVKSGNLLKDNDYAFVHLATSALEAALQAEVELLVPIAPTAQAGPVALSLVPLEQIDRQMALNTVSRPFDLQYSEQLATLGVRLGLLLGRDLVRAAHNPFRPTVFLAALHAAWCEFEPDPEAHGLLAPLLRPGLMIDLGPLYESLIEALKAARKGKDDDTRFAKTDDRAARRAERARREASLSDQLRQLFDPALVVPEIPNLPQGSGGWRPSTASGFSVAAAEPGLAASLEAIPQASLQAGLQPVVAAAGFQHGAPGHATPLAGHGFAQGGAGTGAMTGAMPLIDLLGRLGAGAAIPGMPDLPAFAMSAGARDTGQGGDGSASAPGVPHGAFYLPRLRASLPPGALSRGDATTLDLLSRVFEGVLQDDGVAPETRELMAFLQVPVLKAALRDRSFFYEEAHPARRLLDLLSQAGWEQPASQDDPVYRAMRSSVERVRDAEQPEFAAAVAELEAGLAARDSAEQAAIAGPIANATRQEKQVAAKRSAQRAVALRLAGEQLVPAVAGFLEQRWSAALALAYTIEDSRPGAIDNATRTMEDLIWSVKPKATQEQRKALIARLPALLASLNKWLDATRWQDAERLQFFAELAECHASIVRAPIELAPERQLELAVEAAQQDALRRVAQEQAQAEDEQHASHGPDADALAGLERGMRLELAEGDNVRKVRLAWVSPLRTLYIFSGAGRQEAFSLPAARLADLLRAGAIRVVLAEGVVGRILGAAVGTEAVNDAGPPAGQAPGAPARSA